MLKRLSSAALALAMSLTCLPSAVLAAPLESSQILEETYLSYEPAANAQPGIAIETVPEEKEDSKKQDEPTADESQADTEKEETNSVKDDVSEDEMSKEEPEENDGYTQTIDAEEETSTYKIYLPAGYDKDQTASYPTVYLMPYDGWNSSLYVSDGIQDKLDAMIDHKISASVIVVMPDFKEGEDYASMLPWLVKDVESKYKAISDSQYRALLGVNVGGYMALGTRYLDSENASLFYAYGSHMGDFTSESNPYLAKGDLLNAIESTGRIKNNYFYIDAPNGDPASYAAGGSADIGSALMIRTNPYYDYGYYSMNDNTVAEYAILDGNSDSSFYLSSLERSFNRFSQKFIGRLLNSSLKLTPQAVTSSDASTTAVVNVAATNELSKFYEFAPDAVTTVEMIDPNSGAVLYSASETLSNLSAGDVRNINFELSTAYKAAGTSTTVKLWVDFGGLKQEIESLPLVSVQDIGQADDEKLIDLMGDWHFKAYKKYKKNDPTVEDLDRIANITPETYESWGVVQPGLGWWTSDFDDSLGGNANYGGYAWYVRTFYVPEDFPTEGLILSGGKFDEANEMYINGVLVGSLGMDYTINDEHIGVYDGSNPWDVTSFYELTGDTLKPGEVNTIAVRMCNSSGGGGWYEGPIGIYSVAAYNKATGKPSVYADALSTQAVNDAEASLSQALASKDLDAYKAVIDSEFFQDGYTKSRKAQEAQSWMDAYDSILVSDSNAGVFVDGDLFVYQANRTITGDETELFSGEVLEYFKAENGKAILYGSHSRFFTDSVYSQATGSVETFRVYLPEGYFDEGNAERYATMYLLHGINSQSTTFAIDKVDQLLDEAIADGTIEKMIVVIPDDPTKTSFWKGKYGDMVSEDMLQAADARYRTIADARYRFTAGCSMGGGGAMSLGLFKPDQFSGVISFYGALNYVNAPAQAQSLSKEYLDKYAVYMTCGNMDSYNFYEVQEEMARVLQANGMDMNRFTHTVDNGAHDSIYYLPRFIEGIEYVTDRMSAPQGASSILSGNAVLENNAVRYSISISPSVDEYLNVIPASEYTINPNPDLDIPVQVVVRQNGKTIADITEHYGVHEETVIEDAAALDLSDLNPKEDYEISVYASVLNETVLIENIQKEGHKQCVWDKKYTIDQPATADQDGSKSIHCSVCGEKKNVTVIPKVSNISLTPSTVTYIGGTYNPILVIQDSAGRIISPKYYEVKKPDGRKNVGTYTYTISFKGEYAGTVEVPFEIVPVGTVLTVPSVKKNSITVKWISQSMKMKDERISGYQIRFSTKSSMEDAQTVDVDGYKSSSTSLENLKSNTWYYVQIRTVMNVNGQNYYSSWSLPGIYKTCWSW